MRPQRQGLTADQFEAWDIVATWNATLGSTAKMLWYALFRRNGFRLGVCEPITAAAMAVMVGRAERTLTDDGVAKAGARKKMARYPGTIATLVELGLWAVKDRPPKKT